MQDKYGESLFRFRSPAAYAARTSMILTPAAKRLIGVTVGIIYQSHAALLNILIRKKGGISDRAIHSFLEGLQSRRRNPSAASHRALLEDPEKLLHCSFQDSSGLSLPIALAQFCKISSIHPLQVTSYQ